MTAPFVQSGVIQTAAAASVSPSISGTTAGNLLVLSVGADGSNSAPSQPSGWSTAQSGANTTGGSVGSAIFYQTSPGGTVNVTVNNTGAADMVAQISEYTGTFVFGSGANTPSNGNVTTLTTGTITVPQASSLVIGVFAGTGVANGDSISDPATASTNATMTKFGAGGQGSNTGLYNQGATLMDFEDCSGTTASTTGFTLNWTCPSMAVNIGYGIWKYTASGGTSLAWIKA
jgi:hypothetical protein